MNTNTTTREFWRFWQTIKWHSENQGTTTLSALAQIVNVEQEPNFFIHESDGEILEFLWKVVNPSQVQICIHRQEIVF